MKKLRVGIIFGGRSSEHPISLASATSIVSAIDRSKYQAVPIGITPQGRWLPPAQAQRMLRADNRRPSREEPTTALARRTQRPHTLEGLSQEQRLDVVFPVLHGPYGEDGTIQGLLELMDMPYVGAGVLASAIGMDKALQKALFRQHSLPVVDYLVFLRRRWETDPEAVISQIEQRLSYPCFVKPSNLGSSIGVTKAHSPEELISALKDAAQYDRKLLVERAIEGRELECSVLGNDEPIASPVGEILPAREFYDYEAKYDDQRTQLVIPADLPREVSEEVRRLALEAFKAIDCAGMARVDFFYDPKENRIYINELNTIPGFTQVSMYPKLWQFAGMSYAELIDRLIQLALERHQDKARNRKAPDQ